MASGPVSLELKAATCLFGRKSMADKGSPVPRSRVRDSEACDQTGVDRQDTVTGDEVRKAVLGTD